MTPIPRDLFCGREGLKGFDCNQVVSEKQAQGLVRAGFSFCLRYVPRVNQAPHDLTALEVERLLSNGLAVMAVQHVEAGFWLPSEQKGTEYGRTAAASASACGLVAGSTLWLDLESVDKAAAAETIIKYCNRWFGEVANAGFMPGIYVGFQPGLNATELYYRLRFARYWAAYNLNRDQYPKIAGVCMQQSPQKSLFGVTFDPDTIIGDMLGRFPMLTAPATWNLDS